LRGPPFVSFANRTPNKIMRLPWGHRQAGWLKRCSATTPVAPSSTSCVPPTSSAPPRQPASPGPPLCAWSQSDASPHDDDVSAVKVFDDEPRPAKTTLLRPTHNPSCTSTWDMEAPKKRMSRSPISSLPKPHAYSDCQEPCLSITPRFWKYLNDLLCTRYTNNLRFAYVYIMYIHHTYLQEADYGLWVTDRQ
jgi:hypothetical protein